MSNKAGESQWNESNLWPEWGIYAENTRYFYNGWSNNLTSTELVNFYPPWIVKGWISIDSDASNQYEKDYRIRLKNATQGQTYDLTINFTILVGCTWRTNRENIQVCYVYLILHLGVKFILLLNLFEKFYFLINFCTIYVSMITGLQ